MGSCNDLSLLQREASFMKHESYTSMFDVCVATKGKRRIESSRTSYCPNTWDPGKASIGLAKAVRDICNLYLSKNISL